MSSNDLEIAENSNENITLTVEPIPEESSVVEPIPEESHVVEPIPEESSVVEPIPEESPVVEPIPEESPVVEPIVEDSKHFINVSNFETGIQHKPETNQIHKLKNGNVQFTMGRRRGIMRMQF